MTDRRTPDVGAKVLLYDLETAPNLGYVWGKWQQNVLAFEEQWFILSVAWKWLGEKRVQCLALPDFKLYEKEPHNDRELVKHLHSLFCEADVTIGHNVIAFDNKKASTRMIVHGMDPPPPRKDIDTCQVAKRQFGFTSNKLGDLCHLLGLPAKADAGGFSTWLGCLNGDPKAWAKMKRYNKQDIPTLEALYLRLRPWMRTHPNLNIYGDRPDSCPRCGHDDLMARGYRTANVWRYRRFQCQRCRGYCQSREIHDTRVKYRSA